MNRIKSKQNLNPNTLQFKKREQILGIKTRNQSREIFKENFSNPKKVDYIKIDDKKKANKSKSLVKIEEKIINPQMHYQAEIIQHISKQTKAVFKNFKLIADNKQYKSMRTYLFQSIYKECVLHQLKRKTFYLYVHLIDNFMKNFKEDDSTKKENEFQKTLFSNYACFLMAQKYQEIYPPSIYDWLPETLHKKVYIQQGKILFTLKFKLIYESMQHFFEYWAEKYNLNQKQKQNCNIVLDSIIFNYDFFYRHQPQKIAKAVVLTQLNQKQKRIEKQKELDPFQSTIQKQKIMDDLRKHIFTNLERIQWIRNLEWKTRHAYETQD